MNVYQLSAKNCMSHLLLKDTFDNFSFIEGEITTSTNLPSAAFSRMTSLMKNLKKPTPAGIKPETSASRSSAVNALHWDSRLSLRSGRSGPVLLTAHGLTGYRPEEIRGAVPELPLRWTSLTMYHRNFSEHFHHGQIHRKRMGSGSKKHFKIQIH
mgnify:CR=1 FL=1